MTEIPPPPPPPGAPPPEGAAAATGGGYRVQLPTFEGPLDLLLHLIEEHELDIRDIPIAFIAKKYVEYITLMQEVNIDVASEYLVMAATLAHIKSKMLLPPAPAEEEEDEEAELDPRAELIRRLLEYQKYKHAAEGLAAHDVLGRDVFPRGMPAPQVDGPAAISGLSLFKLLDAFQSVLSRAKASIDHHIDLEHFSITDRINQISEILKSRPRLAFDELFEDQGHRAELIVSFLALLEMTRLRLIRLYQDGPLEMIYIELAVTEQDSATEEDLAGSERRSAPLDEDALGPRAHDSGTEEEEFDEVDDFDDEDEELEANDDFDFEDPKDEEPDRNQDPGEDEEPDRNRDSGEDEEPEPSEDSSSDEPTNPLAGREPVPEHAIVEENAPTEDPLDEPPDSRVGNAAEQPAADGAQKPEDQAPDSQTEP